MKAVAAHDRWDRGGGGELVDVYTVKTLLEVGYDVAIVSLTRFDKDKIKELFGIDLSKVKVYSFLPRFIPFLGQYQRLALINPLMKAVKRLRPDVVFIDCELYKPIVKLKSRLSFKILEYIHFPYHRSFERRKDLPTEYVEVLRSYSGNYGEYGKYNRGLWRYYYDVFLWLYRRIARGNPFEFADIVLTNSRFTARLTKLLWGGEPVILYPPVIVKDFSVGAGIPYDDRDNAVVIVGRISPEKRLEDAVDAIALTSTKPVLRVIGSLNPKFTWYREFIERKAGEKGVEVEFYTNIPRKELVNIVTKSKLFIHTTRYEHFGIAVVEAMAGGCPVIVHKSGGPYEDIVSYGEYGLYYESVEDLAENIDKLLTDDTLWKYYHIKSLERAQQFDENMFKQRFLEIIEKIS
jgi:glycosyltransferase involved in cell wall biosynthesis